MPQRTQNFLIHILLLWTTIISIIQIAILILFFTAGHKDLDSSAVEPSKMPVKATVTSVPPNNQLVLSPGKMLTFKAGEAKSQIKWIASRPDEALISEYDKGLTVKVDGYYFLNLQVTLSAECKESNNHTVSLVKKTQQNKNENKPDKVLLEGSINKETLSTGILSKMEEMGTGTKLVVNINPSVKCVTDTESKTHLDIIFMLRT